MDFPVVSPLCQIAGDCLLLREAGGTRTLQAERELLDAVVTAFDGMTDPQWWVERNGHRWQKDRLTEFVGMLLARGFLVPVSSLCDALWHFTSNPRRFGQPPDREKLRSHERVAAARSATRTKGTSVEVAPRRSELTDLLSRRRTHRGFSGNPMHEETIATLLWAAYGLTGAIGRKSPAQGRTVPSAGALHPLRLYLINMRPAGPLSSGIYAVEPGEAHQPIRLARVQNARLPAVARCFGSPPVLRGAQAVIVITGNFSVSAVKYGPRAMSYVALEAGHAAQNILLMSTELGLAAVETGEFEEQAVARALALDSGETPLTLIVTGTYGPNASWPPESWELQWLDYAQPGVPGRRGSFTARVRSGADAGYAWGSDQIASRAALKAYMEAEERLCAGQPRNLVMGSSIGLRHLSDPRMIRFLEDQEAEIPSTRGPDRAFGWVPTTSVLSGGTVLMPADCVYFRSSLPPDAVHAALPPATSSGVAAHETAAKATVHATLELIERDAFMLAWACDTSARIVDPGTLPARAQRLIAELATHDVSLTIRDISTKFGIVVLAFAQSVSRHFTRVATAAAMSNGRALAGALNEIEPMVRASITGWSPSVVEQEDGPTMHASYYHRPDTFRDADHLIFAQEPVIPYADVGRAAPRCWPDVLKAIQVAGLDLLIVDLGLGEGRPCVVRAIVPGLMPLTFGADRTPVGLIAHHPRAPVGRVRDHEWLTRVPHPMA